MADREIERMADYLENELAFKVSNLETGKVYKIYANGMIEGFDDASCVLNRIPLLMDRRAAEIVKALADG